MACSKNRQRWFPPKQGHGFLSSKYVLGISKIEKSLHILHLPLGISLPEGVDPSFLAALPDDIRREVLQNQLGIRPPTRTAPSTNSSAPAVVGNPGVTEVSPEFLAALPPAIQEEVCERGAGGTRLPSHRYAPIDSSCSIGAGTAES